MSRYKSIKFDKFSDGEQCDILDPTDKSFEISNELVITKNKIKLGKKVQTSALYNLDFELTDYAKTSFLYSSHFYILGVNTVSGECMIKKINVQTGTISVVHTFSGGGNEANQCISFRGKAIVSMWDGTAKVQYANMAMAVWTNCGTIGALTINDYAIVDDRLYVLCNDDKIYYSDDGISFTLWVTLDSSYGHDDLNYLNGYFYVRSWKYGVNNSIIRISSVGEIQDEVISTSVNYDLKSFVFNGNLYLLIDKRFLYCVIGSSLKPIFSFENEVYFIYTFGIVDSISFWDSTDDEIITMNLFEKFSRPFKVISAVDRIWIISKYDNSDTIALCSLSSIYKAIIYEDKYISPGSIQSKIVKIPEGLAISKQLILTNKPLSANAQIKIYIKKDQASAWGDAVIDSNATNAVRKIYDFPTGDLISFLQIKIEYLTADDSESPEDAEVEFLYLPSGLANSK